jgi:hypothetical protein
MKYYKLLLIILVIFLKTGNVLSNSNIFDVNNIQIEIKGKTSNTLLANQAIKKAFKELMSKILLNEDVVKLQNLKFLEIKDLVKYYKVSKKIENSNNKRVINYNISFDKNKIHNLLYKKNISYSEIPNKEIFILPIYKNKNKINIYNKNIFYDKWNDYIETELIEFILPLENIEIIQKINLNRNNLLDLDLNDLFTEYTEKNLALVLIENNYAKEEKIYVKTKIAGKDILKNIYIKKLNLSEEEFNKKLIITTKQEITNLIKAQNLIDLRIPSFLNVKLKISKKNNLVELKSRLKKIDLIEDIYIQKLNNEFVFLTIKYLGKLEKIIKQLTKQKIILKMIDEKWSIEIIS